MGRCKIIITALLVFNVAAQGAMPKDRGDCDKNFGGAQVTACTLVVDDDAQSKSDRAVAYANRGNVLRVENDLELALAYLDKAIRLDPDYAPAYLIRGFIWRDKSDPSRAIMDYNEAIRLNPKYAPAYSHRGLAWLSNGNRTRALADITAGLGIAPGESWCHTARAIYDHLGNEYALAIGEYDQSIRLAPFDNAYAHFGRGVAKL